jgi:hypothetical protein
VTSPLLLLQLRWSQPLLLLLLLLLKHHHLQREQLPPPADIEVKDPPMTEARLHKQLNST